MIASPRTIYHFFSTLPSITPASARLWNLPEETSWESVSVCYETLIGGGNYGYVFLGHWRHERSRTISVGSISVDSVIDARNVVTETVAVKMARSGRCKKRSHE